MSFYVGCAAVSATPTELRQQLDTLQAELSARTSTLHFAHAGVSLVAALIIAGAAGKLSWDSPKFWYLGAAVGVLAFGIAVYSLVRYLKGRATLKQELEHFHKLESLRRTLHLDDPSALLPK